MRLALMAVALLLTAPLVSAQIAAANVAPGGEWVLTGPPAANGTPIALPDGTALLIGKLVQRYHPDTGGWTPAGSLLGNGGVVTLLSNGKVLVSGLSPAEVYDPLTGVSQLVAAMHVPRGGHQATLLASGGVLVSGGTDANSKLVGPAEIYDPARDTWSLTGVLNQFRRDHAAVLLTNGKVLAAGGLDATGEPLASAEVYDSVAGTWTFTAAMDRPGFSLLGVTLPDGRVLVAGKSPLSSELYDPAANMWAASTTIPSCPSGQNCFISGLVVLHDGTPLVVFAGCQHLAGCSGHALLFDAQAGLWNPTATPLVTGGGMTVLTDGRALLISAPPQLFRPDNTTARLLVSPLVVDLDTNPGIAVRQTFALQNTGGAILTGSATIPAPFSVVSGSPFTLAPDMSTTVVVEFTPAGLGTSSGIVQFMSNGNWLSVTVTVVAGLKLSGRITSGDGVGVVGVPVTLHGAADATTTTNSDGRYAFIVQPSTGYTVTPTDPRATFSPSTRSVLVGTVDVDGLDFVAQATTGVSLAAAVLPSSRSVQVGSPATAFATIINLSLGAATTCGIAPLTSIPAVFGYQTTDPSTNAVTGSPNTPVTIPGGGLQTYVIALTPTGLFSPSDVQFGFDCGNSPIAPVVVGLNTLLLSASTTPVPDIVALAGTLTNDGIVNVPGATGTGVFAVATSNVGAGGSITVSADTGSANLPIGVTLCQTNPATSVCVASATPTVTTQINANATPTFGIFVAGTGTVPFDPANNRVFVRFKDAGGVTRGSTSVAVRTQP